MYTYDDDGNLTSVKNPDGTTTTYTYVEGTSDVATITMPGGGQYSYTYNDNHQLTRSVTATGLQTDYGYDAYGNSTSVTIRPQNDTGAAIRSDSTYTADGNMLASTTGGDRNTITYSNDTDRSLVTAVTDAKNAVTSYSYDSMRRQTGVTGADGSSVSSVYADDYLTSLSHSGGDSSTTYNFSYGVAGLSTAVKIGETWTLVSNDYNSGAWTLAQQLYGNGLWWKYDYDAQTDDLLRRYTNLSDNTGTGYAYTYDSRGQISKIEKKSLTLENGTITGETLLTAEYYGYDAMDRLTRIVVTDSTGLAVYDSAAENNIRGKYTLYPELVRALDGQAVFYSHYTNEAFLSRAAMPVMSSGKTVGAVYVCESDSERAALIGSIQRRLATITIGIGAAALVVLWFSIKMLTRRITQLADGVRTVQRGDYSFRLTLAGDDELTELGREFNNLTERLETTEAQRRRFVSDASHELKTPLASIRLLSDSISQSADMDSETMREFVTDIGSEAERLQRTTEKLLDLSRRDDGVQSDVTVVDLQQAVHGTLHLLRPLAAKSDVTLTCLMSDGVTVCASEDDIYHIVFNLVENAIKYNLPGGSVTVRVEARGEQSILSVADTGIGIPEADRPNIFNRFYRVDKARSREHGGSGLGLSIVHDAAALYGGTVTVDGVEPHGTRFTVTFPRAKADNAPEVQKEVPET